MNPKMGTILLVDQINNLLSKMNDEIYSQPLKIFSQSSIGAHIRHIADFYTCLIRGAVDNNINYEHRDRDLRIEKEISFAITTFCDIKKAIGILDMDQLAIVQTCFDSEELETAGTVKSSIGRELMYAYDHAIHHLAIVKIGLKVEYPDVSIDNNLGVAPSTIKYRKRLPS